MRPIPTEYRGTVFRSKSEAVFARALDLAKIGQWEYEPEHEKTHSPHPWDFSIFDDRCKRCHWILIEYKPSQPTMTYVRHLTELVRPRVEVAVKKHGRRVFDSYIVWGNPWDGPQKYSSCSYVCYPIFSSWTGGYGWGDFNPVADCGEEYPFSYRHNIEGVLGVTEPIIQAARNHRFDLVAGLFTS